MKRIAVIGGGASGALSAILLKKYCECDVTIFEKQNRILKKVLNTGNGMCNISNENCNDIDNILNYYNTDKICDILRVFNVNKLKEVFDDLGLIISSDSSGRYYPLSRKASSVIDVMLRQIEKENINVCLDTEIIDIKEGFVLVDNNRKKYSFDYVIISSGGKSSISFDNKIYDVMKGLGHKLIDLKPSLVGFKVKENVKSLSGIRIKGNVSLYKNKQFLFNSVGEIQFKDDGISGICVMELSRFYNKGKDNFEIEIDLMSDYCELEIKELLNRYFEKYKNINEVLLGVLPKMFACEICKKCNSVDDIVYMIKHFKLSIIDTYGFKFSQVTRGGISLDSVKYKTLESKLCNNLYVCGEALDVDGTCGGYNLHFAWASAYVVTLDIVKKVGERV